MAAAGEVPHNDFISGFYVGYQAIMGTARALPALPARPGTRNNSTPFLMGVRLGLERAGIDLNPQT